MVTIYHNGRCSKSRGALEILQEKGIPHEVRWYLAEPLSAEEIRDLLQKLGVRPEAIVRKSEQYFQEALKGKTLDEDTWISELAAHPELIERPIVVNGDKAVVARPPERVLELVER
jgi:arsenate reductase